VTGVARVLRDQLQRALDAEVERLVGATRQNPCRGLGDLTRPRLYQIEFEGVLVDFVLSELESGTFMLEAQPATPEDVGAIAEPRSGPGGWSDAEMGIVSTVFEIDPEG
jgi:hypothetical protein